MPNQNEDRQPKVKKEVYTPSHSGVYLAMISILLYIFMILKVKNGVHIKFNIANANIYLFIPSAQHSTNEMRKRGQKGGTCTHSEY